MTIALPSAGGDVSTEVLDLIEVIRAADQRLDTLLAGEIDTVVDRHGQPVVLRRALGDLRVSEHARQAAILSALPANIALLDAYGVIVSVNAAWRQFGEANATQAPGHEVGTSYLDVCDGAVGDDASQAHEVAHGLRAVLEGRQTNFSLEYACHSPALKRWFLLRVAALSDAPMNGAVVMHTEITERRLAQALREAQAQKTARQERLLDTVLSSLTDLTFIVDRQRRVLFANEPLLQFVGLGAGEATGRTLGALPLRRPLSVVLRRRLSRVFSEAVTVTGEVMDLHAGQEQYFEYILSPAAAPDGSAEFAVACLRDITARKLSEAALLDSVAQFRTLAAAMPQIVWVTDADGTPTYFNQRWIEYTGVSLQDSLAQGWGAAMHPSDRAAAIGKWSSSVSLGVPYSREIRLRRQDGSYRWWMVRAASRRDEGMVIRWIGTCTDIHELKVAQLQVSDANATLQRQSSELRVLFDLVPAMVWFKDPLNNIVRVNERAAERVGLSVLDIEGQPASAIYPQEPAQTHASDLEVIRSGHSRLGIVEQVFSAAAPPRWTQTDKVPYRDEHGRVIGIVVMSQDITQHKQDQEALRNMNAELELRVVRRTAEMTHARQEAEQANQAKSSFLAAMSHEIRTPMSGLLGLLELLQLSELTPSQQATLRSTRESGDALLHIIDDILDFSKIEANHLELDLVATSVREVLHRTCRLHSQFAAGKGLAVNFHVDAAISPWLLIDPLRLGQILNNFVNNAIKFTERGKVDLDVRLLGRSLGSERLGFSVRDTGIGISADQQARLFQPFTQAGTDTSRRYGGTGLGLVISRRLADLMDGTVAIRSQEGRGTELTLNVAFEICEVGNPAATREQLGGAALALLLAGKRKPPTVAQAEAEGTLLLLVDDHPTNRTVLERQVGCLGYASELAFDGQQALDLWRTGRFGAVITDCNMPELDGYQLARAIRALEASSGARRAPIIAYTANALASATQECLEAGMDDCIVKPADLAQVHARLQRWIPLPEAAAFEPKPQGVPPSRPGVMSRAGLLDTVMLATITGPEHAAQVALLEDFRRINRTDVAALEAACAAAEAAAITRFAHRIRGACLMLGATRLAAACSAVQDAAAGSPAPALGTAMQDFGVELAALDACIDDFSGQQGPEGREG